MKLQLQFSTIAAAAVLSLSSAVAWAHFGIVIPEHSAVLEQKDANVHFTIAFAHPMERNGMTMAKPDAFYVVQDSGRTDAFSPVAGVVPKRGTPSMTSKGELLIPRICRLASLALLGSPVVCMTCRPAT